MQPRNLSIIIISKNEEHTIGRLLRSIKKQKLSFPYEVILADNASSDATVRIAKAYGVSVVSGGLPAAGRNSGARHSTGDMLLFLDADTILPDNFITNALDEFFVRRLAVATPLVNVLTSNRLHRLAFAMGNLWMLLTEHFYPHAAGTCILVSAGIHKKNGFDEKIVMAEDSNYAVRASKHGKFGILRRVRIMTYARRFEKDGTLRTMARGVAHTIFRVLLGDRRADRFAYDFNHSSNNTVTKSRTRKIRK